MIVVDLGPTRPAVDRCVAAIAVGFMLLGPAAAAAQTLPRVEGPLTMEEAVDLARQKNLRVKAADADARTMDSMRKEALAPFWPQLSANGYFNDQRLAPSVFSSAGNTMARNYQVFNADQTRDANFTACTSLFSGADYYGYQAAAPCRGGGARCAGRRGGRGDAGAPGLHRLAAEAENVRVTGDLLRTSTSACASPARCSTVDACRFYMRATRPSARTCSRWTRWRAAGPSRP
jgi:hypothetical protein